VRLVGRRHDGVDLALAPIQLRIARFPPGAGVGSETGAMIRSIRERKLPERSNATSSVVPSNSPVKRAFLFPTRSEIRDEAQDPTPWWPRDDLEPVGATEREAAGQRVERLALDRPIGPAGHRENVPDDQFGRHAPGFAVGARKQRLIGFRLGREAVAGELVWHVRHGGTPVLPTLHQQQPPDEAPAGRTRSGSQPHGRGPQSGVKTWPRFSVTNGTTACVTERLAPRTSWTVH
jgi:hypothetical protein